MKIVLVTGGFDPIHSGHIAYFNSARELGDKLIVGLNSDSWLARKKGRSFMPITERTTILQNLRMVDGVILFNDDDGSSVEAIKNVKQLYPNDTIIFANGGDRTANNIPEMLVSDVVFKFGVGGDTKANSSSWILDDWKAPKTERPWGYYRVLHEVAGTKVKELTIEPGKALSMQRHKHRAEYWHVAEGRCMIESMSNARYHYPTRELIEHHSYHIPKKEWHRLSNPYDVPCRIVEIQYGTECSEADIERD
jgi:D-beta-D-heptose 7-phosphate kinase/D-beta-D-heptose 1-phosphate adenosyltransferase